MQKGENCIGCKTSFEQGTSLPLEDLVIELKNYNFPIRDQKHRWILLKTIVSLLNSKGGIVFVGAEDKTGQVIGLQISRKQQDQFKLFIQKLVQRIQPAVDLSNREDIIMQFVPVTRGGAPTGKYLGKIIVKQGQTNKLYCFSQKVLLQSVNDKKYDQFDVVYSFKRINMGSVKELQGYDVVLQASNRAANPPKTVNIFHEGCNPQPLSLSYSQIPTQNKLQNPSPHQSPKQMPIRSPTPPTFSLSQQPQKITNYAIQFFKIRDSVARQKLENKLQQLISQVGAKQYNISYEEQTDTLVIQFADKKYWNSVLDLIDGRLQDVNDALNGDAVFQKKQAGNDYAVYENQKLFLRKCTSGEVCQMKEEVQERPKSNSKKYVEKIQKSPKKIENAQKFQRAEVSSKIQVIKEQFPELPPLQNKSQSLQQQISKNPYKINIRSQRAQRIQQSQKTTQNSSKKPSQFPSSQPKTISVPPNMNLSQITTLTITHLNISKKKQLIKYIEQLSNSTKKQIQQYERSVQFSCRTRKQFIELYKLLEKSKDIIKYGFNKIIIFGINTGQITFDNYDRNKYREFKDYIGKAVGGDLVRSQFMKRGTKYSLLLTLSSASKAAIWLDKFINDQDIKLFRIPNNQSLKMKIDLVCIKPDTSTEGIPEQKPQQ